LRTLSLFLFSLVLLASPLRLRLHDQLVLDDELDLLWDRCAIGQTFNGITCTGQARKLTILEAGRSCSRASARLPALEELQALLTQEAQSNYWDPHFFPGSPADKFWTSSRFLSNPGIQYRLVDFYSGQITAAKTGAYYVRCVRALS